MRLPRRASRSRGGEPRHGRTPLNLERNVSLAAVRAFKLVTLTEVDAIVAVVRRLLPG